MKTISKIATVGLKAALDAIFDETKFSEDEKIDRVIKLVNSMSNKLNAGLEAYQTAKRLHNILLNYDREIAISLVCEFNEKYDTFIRIVFGHRPQPQPNWMRQNVTDCQLQKEIKFLRTVVYLAASSEEAIKTVGTELIKLGYSTYKQHKQKKQEEKLQREQYEDFLFQQCFGDDAEYWKILLK
jgi:hypothetical protein